MPFTFGENWGIILNKNALKIEFKGIFCIWQLNIMQIHNSYFKFHIYFTDILLQQYRLCIGFFEQSLSLDNYLNIYLTKPSKLHN
jgi:hypothetical protein